MGNNKKHDDNFYREMYEQAPLPFQALDSEGLFIDVNEEWLVTLGYEREEVIGAWFGDFIAPEFQGFFRENFPRFKEKGKTKAEFDMIRKDGTRINVVFKGRIKLDKDGNFERTQCIFFDNSDRHKAEESLKETDTLLDTVFSSTQFQLVYLDRDFNFVKVNQAYADACKQPKEHFPGTNHFDLYPHEENEEIFRKVVETGEPFVAIAKPFVFSDQPERGTTYWDWTLIPVKNENEYVEGLVFSLHEVTQQKQAEKELLNEKLLSEDYINSLPGLFYVFDKERFVKFNKEWESVTGYSADEISAKYGTDFFEGKDKQIIEEKMLSVFQEGSGEAEANIVTKDGCRIPYYFTGLRKNINGKDHLLGLGINITERTKEKEKLEISDLRLDIVSKASGVVVWDWNIITNELDWRDNYYETFGYSKEDTLPTIESWTDFIHPDDAENVIAGIHKVIDSGKTKWEAEYRFRKKDGSYAFTVDWGMVIHDEKGKPVRMIGAMLDITDRQRTDEALIESEEKLRRMFSFADYMVCVADLGTGHFTKISPAFTRHLGWSEEELLSKPFIDFIHPDDIQKTAEIVKDQLARGVEVLNFENRYRTKSGDYRWFEWSANPVPAENLTYSVAYDITDRKEAEKELQHAKEKAEQVNEAKTEFLMNVSHDIRTPMNVINGFNELLMKTSLNEEQKKFCLTIKRKGHDLISMIEEVMDITAVEKGKIRLHDRPFSLLEFVEDVDQTVNTHIGEKEIAFGVSIDDALPQKLVGDSMRLKQILENLSGNAVKYTDKGKISITISTDGEIHDDGTRTICFVVEDTGIGIPEDKLPHIFEPYSRFYELGKYKEKDGVGMGLHIVETLVKEMGGEVGVESKPGKGSKFTVKIKMKDSGLPTSGETYRKPEKPSEETDLAGLYILIVEDDEDTRDLMRMALKKDSSNIQFAINGEETLKVLKQEKFDLVLMDLHMPWMNGYETTKAIRKDLSRDIPIIALTANDADWVKDKCKEAGMNGYISKPIDIEKLKSTIREHVT